MKSKSIFLMAVSLGFGLIAAIGIRQVLGRSNADTKPKTQMVPVVVAAEDIDASTLLTPEMVTIEQMPIQNAPEGAVTSLKDIEGKVIRSRVSRRFPINMNDLVEKSQANVLSIPPGYKVIGIKVAADGHINGLLQPGDLVDVIGIFRQGPNGQPLAKTFLQKVRVFSVDGDLIAGIGREAKARSTTVVSVLATKKQSEKLVLVQRMAELKIVMLGKDVQEDVLDYEKMAEMEAKDPETTLSDVLGGNSGLDELLAQSTKKTRASSPDDEFTMRITSSSGQQIFRFGQDGQMISEPNRSNETPSATDDVFPDDGYSEDSEGADSGLFDEGSDNSSDE